MVAVWLSVPVPLIVQATGTVMVAVDTESSAFVLFDNKNAPVTMTTLAIVPEANNSVIYFPFIN